MAEQDFLVDLRLNGNTVKNLRDGVAPDEAVTVAQLNGAIGDAVVVPDPTPGTGDGSVIVWDDVTGDWIVVPPGTPGAPVPNTTQILPVDGLTGGGPLTGDVTIALDLGQALTFNPGPPTPTTPGGGVTINAGLGLQFGADRTSGIPIPNGDFLQVNKVELDKWYPSVPAPVTPPTDGSIIIWDGTTPPGEWTIVAPGTPGAPVSTDTEIIAGVGLWGGGPLDGPSVDLHVDYGTSLMIGPTGSSEYDKLIVDPAWLLEKINVIDVDATGAAYVTEFRPGEFIVHVPALVLASTYVGPGTDSASINADLGSRPVISVAGDLYINDGSGVDPADAGKSFLNTGLGTAPNFDWVALQSAGAVTRVGAADLSIVIPNPTGPNVTVAVNPSDGLFLGATGLAVQALQDGGIAVGPGGVYVDPGAGISRSADGVTVNLGKGLQFGLDATSGTADPAGDWVQVDKAALDAWYPSIPPTDLTTPPGTTIVWDGNSWELVLPGTLPPPAPSGTLIGAATVVVVPGVVVTGGTGNVPHGLGNNNVIAVVQDAAGCQVAASVCGGGIDPANDLTIQAEDGTYTVIVTGIKTA